MQIHQNYSLKKHNTFGIDVCCKYYAEVKNENEITQLLSEARFKNKSKLIIGGGSNILFTKDFDGLVINQISNRIILSSEDEKYAFVSAEAGVIWHELVLFCVNKNLGGIENLSLIPGKVGAAPIQNIGAYGQELKNVFHSLKGIHIDDLKAVNFSSSDCKFGYRDSIFKKELKSKIIITEVILRLNKYPELNTSYGIIEDELSKLKKDNITIKNVSDIVCQIRRNKLPDPQKLGNAGSFFKNPEISIEEYNLLKSKYSELPGLKVSDTVIKIPAGWLIEKCGFKGKRIGNVGIHEKQALVIVNYGNGKPEEILKLKNKIIKKVNLKFNLELQQEVNII
ncbi:MAG: UDP-N-acetylenolpyruvoylglucosamine reductase [Ignavibacteria bacterium RIFOXYC2_FULL_35_16]|nr:MAG: UDP-N-acetylenolpyruvoylglucosamine reductase [Ignavibacteria bacterium GWA2_36_19]OGU56586.1 MAG: UDP-N-acetylenolpyruvoylglucosamine reductase [Ignavibacteria bacterium GWF2_35_20]OGU81362.1 MAG: UDP-N-acetylenolpyruvoylglucosamine reductase [Ignavibacteria bacterium RIFOXYA2_FULL_35_9]OGU87726.1 MAG: UDP-N-acetylenolpyruvoylglucosamine reductase [Ignavibacteria bacterium RIFOXYC12_FULL_35_11]OGU87930.1 MAG: UDP-N-acetylenolpyruvoylglucosamine reductase [Ignavibacteria bacterium RIFOX